MQEGGKRRGMGTFPIWRARRSDIRDMALGNCKRCGAMFSRTDMNICPKCIKKEEVDFELAAVWLRDNPGKTIQELSEETGIEQSFVLKWVREKRITMDGTSGLLKCSKCGIPIEGGEYCDHCKLGFSQAVSDGLKTLREATSAASEPAKGMHYRPSDRGKRGR